MKKQEFINLIGEHIRNYGYHLTIVAGKSPLPRYCYSIGLLEKFGFELAFAGGDIYKADEIKEIIDKIIEQIKIDQLLINFSLGELGNFKLQLIDESWSTIMFDGIYDFYKSSKIKVYQIMPDEKHKTLEVPNMSLKFDAKNEPIWKWLTENWIYPISQDSIVFTDVDALFGKKILEIMRWEELEWEMFTSDGTEIPTDKKRVVSFGTILGIDNTIAPAMNLNLEKGLFRDEEELEWNDWG
ncbi:hypothetical protein DRF59_11290 [Chryseobacterium flavum]|uniref:DUF4262 domain-containing protein n=1 Tax=Chryseobacterium flavum TaxID=415851 RepID=A0A3D9CMA9_9FLAO|nr:DUF4262 domain-containing protein [Chryseobacterium flavum]REC66881.1 hypothetical protein DRF59_11290 [Chryseobacterium flavum]